MSYLLRKLTVEQLLSHAKKFGSEGVIETAMDAKFSFEQLVRLLTGLDKVDKERDAARVARGHYSTWKKPRKSAEDRVKRLLGIEEEDA